MAKKNAADLLTSVDELFTTQMERDEAKRESVIDISLSEIDDFPMHPFQVRMDTDMMDLADSVRRYGVLVPGLIRPTSDGRYQMVAGHRRKKASEMAEKSTMPCIVRELTDDEAIVIMVDSNLQRETVLPSEKAFAYKMRLEAMKRQGQRPDLTSCPVGKKLWSADKISNEVTDSSRQIHRYIRLTELIPPILDMVDQGKIAFRPAVELSYLRKEEQENLLEAISYEDATPSLAQAIKMKKFSQEGRLNADVILSIIGERKPNQREKISFQAERLRKFIPAEIAPKQTEAYILKALEYYQRYRERKRGHEQER